jgi:Xaa-Pro aminopeptidase
MQQKGVNAALVTAIDNVRWLSGFTGSSGFVIVTPSEGLFISDSRYNEQAREQVQEFPVEIFASPMTAAQAIAAGAKRLGVSGLGFEAEHVTFATHQSWKDNLNGVALTPIEDLVDSLRLVKSDDEIKKSRKLAAWLTLALRIFCE